MAHIYAEVCGPSTAQPAKSLKSNGIAAADADSTAGINSVAAAESIKCIPTLTNLFDFSGGKISQVFLELILKKRLDATCW